MNAGDLPPETVVYETPSRGGKTLHLSPRCTTLYETTNLKESTAAVHWDTTKVCSRCAGFNLELPFGVK